MANRIYMYPKSSCNCVNYSNSDASLQEIIASNKNNLGVNPLAQWEGDDRVSVSDWYDSNRQKNGIRFLNPKTYTDNYAKDYVKINRGQIHCTQGSVEPVCDSACNKTNYASTDPRLYNAPHGQYITLDSAPITGQVDLKDVYSEKFKNYGKPKQNYSQIIEGDILYYQDKSIEDPYFSPNFVNQAVNKIQEYRDPMGAIKTEYPKAFVYPNTVNDTACDVNSTDYHCLSWMRDSVMQREDIMTSQMAKINQRRYESRYPSQN